MYHTRCICLWCSMSDRFSNHESLNPTQIASDESGIGDEWWEIHLTWKTIQNSFSLILYTSRHGTLITLNILRKVEDHENHVIWIYLATVLNIDWGKSKACEKNACCISKCHLYMIIVSENDCPHSHYELWSIRTNECSTQLVMFILIPYFMTPQLRSWLCMIRFNNMLSQSPFTDRTNYYVYIYI